MGSEGGRIQVGSVEVVRIDFGALGQERFFRGSDQRFGEGDWRERKEDESALAWKFKVFGNNWRDQNEEWRPWGGYRQRKAGVWEFKTVILKFQGKIEFKIWVN